LHRRLRKIAWAVAVLCALAAFPALGQTLDYKGITIDKDKQTVSFPAAINMSSGMLEYLLVNDTGKTHESLLSTKIQPYDLQVAMLLLGIKPAGNSDAEPPGQITRDYLKTAPELTGDKINLLLSIKGRQMHAEDLVWNLQDNTPMSEGPWVYNGSEIYEGKFLAQIDGSITALVRDSAALMNNPRPGNDDDQIWEVYSKETPAEGTPVEVTIQLEPK
jgi:hypothetical protein